MNIPSLQTILSIIQLGGTVGALSIFLWLLVTGKVIPYRVYRDKVRDCDDWKEIALTSTGGLEKSIDMIDRRRSDEIKRALEDAK